MRIEVIVIWHNKEKKKYYYRRVSGHYTKYYIGYNNQFGHEVILVIDIIDKDYQYSRKTRIIDKIISWLNKVK